MASCDACELPVSKGQLRAKSPNCDASHVFHSTCVAALGRYDPCPGCVASCRFCRERVDEADRVDLCRGEADHAWHASCLKVHDLGPTSDCPECVKELRRARLANPCAACGALTRGVSWTLGCDHGMHPACLEPWDAGRVIGCLACRATRAICPLCLKPCDEAHEHEMKRCSNPTCRSRVIDVVARDHDCSARTFGEKPCFACGKASSEHETACVDRVRSLAKWDPDRPRRFLYACPLCPEFVPRLGEHFSEAHRPLRCKRCGFLVAKSAAPDHSRACGGSKPCPAIGCPAVVSERAFSEAQADPGVLWKDHECRSLYSCPSCDAFFIEIDDMNDHVETCEPDPERPRPKKRRRAAFLKSARIVLSCAALSANQ